jgi:hypothetical protein
MKIPGRSFAVLGQRNRFAIVKIVAINELALFRERGMSDLFDVGKEIILITGDC